MSSFRTLIFALVALAAPVAVPVAAHQSDVGSDRNSITLRRSDLRGVTAAEARARIDRAAMAACGASEASLRVLLMAIRRSACWRDRVAEIQSQLGDPFFAQAKSQPVARDDR